MSNLAHVHPQFEEDPNQDVLIQFDDNTFDPVTPYQEDFTDQVREAQEQLLQLRQQEEQLERQTQELEELQQRKDEFTKGRARLSEQLARSVSLLEREAADAQKRADQCADTRELLEHHHRTVESLRPEMWSRPELREELNRSVAFIEDAEAEIAKAAPLLESMKGGRKLALRSPQQTAGGAPVSGAQGFLYWFKSGLAFTLPVMIFAAIATLLLIAFSGS